jgi:hypothetical protein
LPSLNEGEIRVARKKRNVKNEPAEREKIVKLVISAAGRSPFGMSLARRI